ncbi:MAG TPA: 5-formyltetrahydrofolate cyclo-ligase, partial [Sphingopyxis sp.]|nr:5-formyltetrahydrofolate cyclo-ligase [Sphingopyxis sp.]
MTDPAETKRQLREKLRFRRRHFAANLDGMARLAAFSVLPEPLAETVRAHAIVAAYVAQGDEPDMLPALEPLGALALPHHDGRVDCMTFRRWRPDEPLVKGPWGTMQPAEAAEAVLPALLFCPLVGFDRRGGRLGPGGGPYHRWVAPYPDTPRIR